jgi:hypothetical protein
MCGMSRHARTEPIHDDRQLLTTVAPNDAALVLDVADLWQAEAFAFELARTALQFADSCRSLMGATP